MHVHKPALGGRVRTPQQRCGTTTDRASQIALGHPRFKAFKPPPEVGKFGRSDEDRGKFLYDDAGKVKVLFLFDDFSECFVNAFRAEVEAQLPNN